MIPQLDELDLIDLTIKKFTRPKLQVDSQRLSMALTTIRADKETLREAIGVTAEDLLSDAKFAELLKAQGVTEMPMKWSEAKKRYVPTFAKVSGEFLAMRGDPKLRPYVDARLGVKSTIEETRIQRILDITKVGGSRLGVPLIYYGAHTGRFSGKDINLQNLPRQSVIREALHAPMGHLLIACDLAQIEARITAVLAGQWDLVAQFARGEDVYCNFGSDFYRRKITKEDTKERFLSKTAVLSLGFGASAAKFHNTMNDVYHVEVSQQEADRIVRSYRSRFDKIPKLWTTMDRMLGAMREGVSAEYGPLRFEKERIILPNGMPICYPQLERDSYHNGRQRVKIYGAKAVENGAQSLARIVMTTAELRLAKHGLHAVMSVHDELVFCVKEKHAELIAAVVKSVMEQPVKWMPKLPVLAEVQIGRAYSDCK